MASDIIKLSDHFGYRRLLRFTAPSIAMMVISSVYGVVDGIMVSNFVGKTPFAAVNLVWPFVTVLSSFGFMFGTGGTALVSKTLGEGNALKARGIFSMLTYSMLALAFAFILLGNVSLHGVAVLLGAEGELLDYACRYARILLCFLPAGMCQIYFQSFLSAAERPKMGMWITASAGVTNVVLDLLFIGVFGWGLEGAALATGLSQCVGGLVPLGFFAFRRSGDLRLGRARWSIRDLGKSCSNGLSEFVMNLSLSLVSMLYMTQLLDLAGEDGVAAYGVIMYFAFVFVSIFLGYSVGCAPVVGYHYGAGDRQELRSLLSRSLKMISCGGVIICMAAQLLSRPLSSIIVGYDADLLTLASHAFRIYALHYLVTGFNIYTSAFFTALNNGPVSALISLLRTIVFEAGCVLVMPIFFGIEGLWWAVFVAEGITAVVSFYLLARLRARYGY